MLAWVADRTVGYDGVRVVDLTRSFADGRAFVAIVHSADPRRGWRRVISRNDTIESEVMSRGRPLDRRRRVMSHNVTREREVVSRDRPLGRATDPRRARAALFLLFFFFVFFSLSLFAPCEKAPADRASSSRGVCSLSSLRTRTSAIALEEDDDDNDECGDGVPLHLGDGAARRATANFRRAFDAAEDRCGGRFVVRRAADDDRYGADAIVKRPGDPLRLWFRSLCVKKRAGPLTRRMI